jgi:fucose 4-O-acetylase-like acetyltransferase
MDKSNDKNITWVNGAMTLAIALIILGHLPVGPTVYGFIYAFRLPFFLLITGYLLAPREVSFHRFSAKKARTLLLPYGLFAALTLVFWYFLGRHYGDDAATAATTDIRKYLMGLFLAIPDKNYLGFNFPIWFLPSLFCAEALFFAIRKRRYAFPIALLCFGLGMFLKAMHVVRLPYGIDVSLCALLFIQTGYWIRQRALVERYVLRPSFVVKIGCAAVLFGLTYLVARLNGGTGAVSMVNRTFHHPLLYFAGALAGSSALAYLGACLPQGRFFIFFGRNTLVLLGLHLPALSLIKGAQVFLLHRPLEAEPPLTVHLVYVVLTLALLAPVIYGINRYAPGLLGRQKGIY